MSKEHKKVLVLGSSGLIGSALVKKLQAKGLNVTEYDVRRQLSEDLTHAGYNQQLRHVIWQADFVYFLAFDVGGSKYLGDKQKTFSFIHNNMRIMVNVFDALSLCKTPFIFTSSMMAKMPWSTYGMLKSIGEEYTSATGGCNVRFWNVYGLEPQSEKSHVISDFVHQAATVGEIHMLTKGDEKRQFIHVEDAVEALETLRENWSSIEFSSRPADFDISDGHWTDIATVARKVSDEFGGVPIFPGSGADVVQKDSMKEPDMGHLQAHPYNWKRKITMVQGIRKMVKEYKAND